MGGGGGVEERKGLGFRGLRHQKRAREAAWPMLCIPSGVREKVKLGAQLTSIVTRSLPAGTARRSLASPWR